MQEESLTEHVDMPGILLQDIDGFHLADLAQHALRETWQSIYKVPFESPASFTIGES